MAYPSTGGDGMARLAIRVVDGGHARQAEDGTWLLPDPYLFLVSEQGAGRAILPGDWSVEPSGEGGRFDTPPLPERSNTKWPGRRP